MEETKMRRTLCTLFVILLVAVPLTRAAENSQKISPADRRQEIDAMATEALDQVLADSSSAKKLYESAAGYAVFDDLKFALGVSGGGGSGVAVDLSTGERTYMKMGTGGVGVGVGGEKYQVVFLFENEKALRDFIDKGWKAETSAQAAAGTAGVGAEAGFRDGVAYYQLTDKGLMASADISGTRYWKNKKLNR
jgi:lipid-binding SYLF domain-containing protein